MYICIMKRMKMFILLSLVAAWWGFVSCENKNDKGAEASYAVALQLFEQGKYRACLDSITLLRDKFPQAIEVRRQALKLWQDASLKLTQEDIARTDSALQAVTKLYEEAKTIRERNFIGIVKDSLQIRYDALCGTVRVIHRRQQER